MTWPCFGRAVARDAEGRQIGIHSCFQPEGHEALCVCWGCGHRFLADILKPAVRTEGRAV